MRTRYINLVNKVLLNYVQRVVQRAHLMWASLSIFRDNSAVSCEAAPVPLESARGKTSLERKGDVRTSRSSERVNKSYRFHHLSSSLMSLCDVSSWGFS